MASMDKVFDIMLKLEFNSPANALHANKTETGYTFMGIYQKAHPHLNMWKKVDEVVAKHSKLSDASRELYSDAGLLDEVKMFYKKNFWDRMRLDEIQDQHKANEMFVFGVNAGCGRSIRLAQLVVGTVADGLIGPNTIKAINAYDVDSFDREFDSEEIKYYEAIVSNNPEKKIFLNGWKNRAVAV